MSRTPDIGISCGRRSRISPSSSERSSSSPCGFRRSNRSRRTSGLLSAGLAIALRDVVQNIAGWLFVVWGHPFVVGERIQIGEYSGDVIDVRLLRFSLLEIGNWVDGDQTTGRVIHIPAGWALTKPMVNYERGLRYIWNEIKFVISSDSDWHRAKEIILEAVDRLASRPTRDAVDQA